MREPAGAEDILLAFEEAASGVEPIVALSRGFSLAVRHNGHGVLSPAVRRAITDTMWWAERAAREQLPVTFEPARLRKGVEALYVVICAWAEPIGTAGRDNPDVEVDRLNVRIVANDLDTVCAVMELARGSGTRLPVLSAANLSTSTTTH